MSEKGHNSVEIINLLKTRMKKEVRHDFVSGRTVFDDLIRRLHKDTLNCPKEIIDERMMSISKDFKLGLPSSREHAVVLLHWLENMLIDVKSDVSVDLEETFELT